MRARPRRVASLRRSQGSSSIGQSWCSSVLPRPCGLMLVGCRQDTHIEERLVGRAAGNARAALRLLRSGYYDEALGLIRQIGETANLVSLFVQSEESQEEWKGASQEETRYSFSPVKVRLWLEDLPLPLPMDQEICGLLSSQSVHANPHKSPQSHNLLSIPTMGGYFQEDGALLNLNHLGSMVGWMLWLAVKLIKPPTDRRVIVDASVSLLRSIGGVNLNSIQDRYDEIRESPNSGARQGGSDSGRNHCGRSLRIDAAQRDCYY